MRKEGLEQMFAEESGSESFGVRIPIETNPGHLNRKCKEFCKNKKTANEESSFSCQEENTGRTEPKSERNLRNGSWDNGILRV